MNPKLAADAYNKISEGFAMLALAIEQPAAGGAKSSPPPTSPAPVDDDLPPLLDDYGTQIQLVSTPRPIQDQHVENALSQCPDHQRAWKAVPAGVSKRTGKEYSAFYSCPERDCKKKPVKAWEDAHPIRAAA